MSVEAVQTRSISELEAAVAVKFEGGVGGVVSGAERVVAVAVFEYALRLPAESVALTR